MKRLAPAAGLLALLVPLFPGPLSAAPSLVFTEINYRSRGIQAGDDAFEFVEILNLEAPHVDLSGWQLAGKIRFRFPDGIRLAAGECLVVARDPRGLAGSCPRARRIAGPFAGALDDGGGRILLLNPAGAVLTEMRYGRDGAWPAAADGTGHTLVLRHPFLDPTEPRSWAASALPGGTPGLLEWGGGEEPKGELLVRKGDRWKFLRGNRAPPPDWPAPGADDSRWEEGPSGFGFADDDDATVIDDMVGSYLALYTRRTFTVRDAGKAGLLFLRVDYDDAFRAVLNGREIARGNLPPGVPVTHRTAALGTREPGTVAVIPLGTAASLLREGPNTLAVEVHNQSLRSSDLSLIVELERREAASDPAVAETAPVLNEVLFAGASGWVEIHNPSPRPLPLDGWSLSDDPLNLRKFPLPPGAVVPPRGFLSLSAAELGGGFSIGGPLVCLVPPGGERVADALRRPPGPSGRGRPAGAGAERPEESAASTTAVSFGRYPDGAPEVVPLGAPTPGLPNRGESGAPVVIHEIMYHPSEGDPSGEWIELHCPGSDPIDLGGHRLAGGIRFEFPAGTRLAPGGYLVVAKDPDRVARAHGLTAGEVLGPFRGSLSDGGDRIALCEPAGRTVDRVEFGDGRPWPEEADGRGPSLELVNPAADNSLAGAWSASDETARAGWREYRYQKTFDTAGLVQPAFFQLLLIEEGACLVDDLVLADDSGRAIFSETFEGPPGGNPVAEGWTAHGTHARSRAERSPDGGTAYLLEAGGRGNPRFNYVSSPALKELRQGATYTVSFRARWVRGSRLLLTRVSGQVLAKTHTLELPAAMGTPGRPNGRHREEWAPLVGTPRQNPVAPRSAEAVGISVTASARSQIRSAVLRYRPPGSPEWEEAALRAGPRPGLLEGTIPPQSAGMVEFYVSVTDSGGLTGTYPSDAPERTALYAVGLEPRGRFPTFAILVSEREWQKYRTRERLSNLLLDATLVHDGSRIIYNVGLRPRGSPFTRSQGNWRVVLGAETIDGRGTLTLDAQQGGATNLNERLTYWLLDQVGAPTPRQRYVQVVFVGHQEESGLYEDNDKIDGDFLDRWFPAASRREGEGESPPAPGRGLLHKVDDHWEMIPAVAVRRSGFDLGRLFGGGGERAGAQAYAEAFLKYRSEDPEDYRWNFTPRCTDGVEDFTPLIKLIRLLDPNQTDDRRFLAEVESVVDVDGWLRVLAARTIANDWDTIGRERGKNAFLYLSPQDHRWHLLPWDSDLSWSQSFMNGRYALRSIYPRKFPEFVRILRQPGYRRRFHTYLAYLAGKMEAGRLEGILRETRSRVGTSPQRYLTFAEFAVGLVRREVPTVPFRVDRSARLPRSGKADLLRVSGSAPVLVHRFTLDGREGEVSFAGGDDWTASFPVGPEGGESTLLGLDPGGAEVVRAVLQVPARAGAAPLPVREAEPEVTVIER